MTQNLARRTKADRARLAARCREEYLEAFGRPWDPRLGRRLANASNDEKVITARTTSSAMFDELRRWAGRAQRHLDAHRKLADDRAERALLPELSRALDALRERGISADDERPPWRSPTRSSRGRLVHEVVSTLKVPHEHFSARELAIVSLLVNGPPEEWPLKRARPMTVDEVINAEADTMRKAAASAKVHVRTSRQIQR